MLDPTSRVAIIVVSGLCVTASLMLSPVRARGLGTSDATPLHAEALRTALHPIDAAPIVRDPFAQPPTAPAPTTAAPGQSARPATAGNSVEALPSNLSSDSIPAIPGAQPNAPAGGMRVTAIVTGTHPYALVEIAGVHAIKGIGDRISGTPITSIDLSGITLQNGQRFAVDAGSGS